MRGRRGEERWWFSTYIITNQKEVTRLLLHIQFARLKKVVLFLFTSFRFHLTRAKFHCPIAESQQACFNYPWLLKGGWILFKIQWLICGHHAHYLSIWVPPIIAITSLMNIGPRMEELEEWTMRILQPPAGEQWIRISNIWNISVSLGLR